MENIKKTTFKSIERFKHSWQDYKEHRKDVYVRSGEDNYFPHYIIDLYNRSSIHAAAINATVEAIIGGGLTANVESYLDKANTKDETWNDLFSKIALDFYLHNSFALEIIWSRDRSRIAEVYHIDYSHIRAKEKDYRGHIPGWFISSDWDKKGRYAANIDDAIYLPSYNRDEKELEPNQIFVYRNYRPGQEYYTLPVYSGGLRVAELDTHVDSFHTSNILNGMSPSLMITTFTNGTDDDVQAIEQQLRNNYAGPENAGSLMYIDVDSPENAPRVEPIPQNGADSYYLDLNNTVVQKILSAHRISSPTILGIATAGALGQRNEMIDAMMLWQNTVIAPFQQDLLRSIERLLQVNYPDTVLGVESKIIFEDGEVEEDIVTSVETTDAEDASINEETITETLT